MIEPGRDLVAPSDALAPSAAEAGRLDGLVEEIAELEAQIARLHATQVLRTAELVEGTKALYRRGRSRGWSDESQRMVAILIAQARKVSVNTAEHYLCDAVRLSDDLPTVLGILEAGLTTLPAVRAICAETVHLSPRSRPIADEIIADDLVDTPPAQARTLARTRVFEIDPTPPTPPRSGPARTGSSASAHRSGRGWPV